MTVYELSKVRFLFDDRFVRWVYWKAGPLDILLSINVRDKKDMRAEDLEKDFLQSALKFGTKIHNTIEYVRIIWRRGGGGGGENINVITTFEATWPQGLNTWVGNLLQIDDSKGKDRGTKAPDVRHNGQGLVEVTFIVSGRYSKNNDFKTYSIHFD